MTLAHKSITSKEWAKQILKRGKNVDVDTELYLQLNVEVMTLMQRIEQHEQETMTMIRD
jgi:hypothetical protein